MCTPVSILQTRKSVNL